MCFIYSYSRLFKNSEKVKYYYLWQGLPGEGGKNRASGERGGEKYLLHPFCN